MNPSADQLLSWLRSPKRHTYGEYDYFYCDDDENAWYLNYEEEEETDGDVIFDWIDEELRGRDRCRYCSAPMICDASFEYNEETDCDRFVAPTEFDTHIQGTLFGVHDELKRASHDAIVLPSRPDTDMYIEGTLALCPNCWYWHWISGGTKGRICVWDAAVAKMRSFDANAPEGCLEELAIYLRQDPNRWNSLDDRVLERIVAAIWRQNFAHAEVIHVGRPNDGGVDVLFVDTSSRQWLIQVKRRSRLDRAEGVSTLRNLLGAMYAHPTNLGIVVSTADHFSHYAFEWAQRVENMGATIELVDRGKLDRMLQGFHPAFPWMSFLEDNYPAQAEYYSAKGFGRI